MTAIEWCTETWNPVIGCTRVSPGCEHCYAERTAVRLAGIGKTGIYRDVVERAAWTPRWNGRVRLHRALDVPLKRRRPTIWFVNSMGDLFHPAVPDEWIQKVWATMEQAWWHTFVVLTKHADRQRAFLTAYRPDPLFNVSVGISAETADWLEQRGLELLHTPAAHRVLSLEPLLGCAGRLTWYLRPPKAWSSGQVNTYPYALPRHQVDTVLVGGESGVAARTCRGQWIRQIIAACARAGTPCFVKQLGAAFVDTETGTCGRAVRPTPPGYRRLRHAKGGDPDEWPDAFRVRALSWPKGAAP